MGAHSGNETEGKLFGFLSGGGELGSLIRSYDWSQTALDEVRQWPQSLRSALSICLNSNFPIAIYWGKSLILLYNDAWKTIPGNKHPKALGQTAREVWPEIWTEIEPQFRKAFSGEPGGSKDALLPMQRHGYTEECYFDFTFTPIYGEEGKVEGVFNAVIETTYRVINERRTTLLKKLPIQLALSHTCEQVYQRAVAFMKDFSKDIPFALLYTVDDAGKATFAGATDDELTRNQRWLRPLPAAEVVETGACVFIDSLQTYLPDIPNGYWPETPVEGVLVPIKDSKGAVNAFLFCGLSARLRYDDEYRIFLESIANAIMTVAQNIVSLELERERSEQLLQLDKAKTAFFTNISHEFRTPLTLLLGPVEQFLADPDISDSARTQIEPVYRNALRMQKLVNTLLEFSRIEAGRVEASYAQVDIGTFTADLASTFRSAIENAGMQLQVDVEQVTPEVYVDPQMWEKIILNLVSNAFKFTMQGCIGVHVAQRGEHVEVAVSDTGCGIANADLEKLFNRFHRVENSVGRSQEGTGIGLALVKELVFLHKGSIAVESEPGHGTTFTVTIPTGKAHLPASHITALTPSGPLSASNAYAVEALGWGRHSAVRPAVDVHHRAGAGTSFEYTVLVADDNPDMRDYIERLLSEHFTVLTAEDGEDAFSKAIVHKPDLVVCDIMMPRLDGFGLLGRLRSHPELKAVPVIFLSARAGEEAKVQGLNAGADDYLVKPFSARELFVRVSNHIRINQVRRQTEQQFYQLFLQAPAIINVFKGPEHIYEIFHPQNKQIFGDVDYTGMRLTDALPELVQQGIPAMLDRVYQSGQTIVENEMPVMFTGPHGAKERRYFNLTYQPWFDHRGQIQGVLNFAIDVTVQIEAKKAIEKSERNLRSIITQAPVPMCIFRGSTFVVETANTRMLELWGKTEQDATGKPVLEGIPEISGQGFLELLAHVYSTGIRYSAAERPVLLRRGGELEQVFVNFLYEALRDNEGAITGVMAVAIDVTEQVVARRKIEEAEQKARLAIESAALGTYEVDLLTDHLITSPRFNEIWGIREGYQREQLLAHLHPDDRRIRKEAHQLAAVTGSLAYDARVIWDDQSVHWIRVMGNISHDESGRPVTLLGVIQDISEQKRFSEQLHVQVRERTQQLQRSNEDLQQFAHVASHDLKEPVRKIKLFSGRLQAEYAPLLPEKAESFIQKIQQATDRMFAMIDGVLLYSSLNAEQDMHETVDLNQVIDGIESDLEVVMEQKHALIRRGPLPVIHGSGVLLYQLFYNLINNSLKFSRQDAPPVISVFATQTTESTAEMEQGGNVEIVVSDNGIGFDQQHAGRIFETFTRLNRKDDYEGTGLGLALCKKIVERHHGSIRVESEVQVGTSFFISLPHQFGNQTDSNGK